MFIKLGELLEITGIESAESCLPAIDPKILSNFQKTAQQLKKIAPKAEDFLYFSAVMMHAAEASAIHDDGSIKLGIDGNPLKVGWDKSKGTLRWVTSDPHVLPYRNSNGDIFPEEELVKAHKKWVGKPLCIDHQSNSVDHVRGYIVDTYYDRKLKRVVALCALDKAGYPQLARQVSTGVSTNVSMGTAVGKAICADCATVAQTEADFCYHMKSKSGYGEINVDLNPIELSIVVNGADPKAHIKDVLASANILQAYVNRKEKEFNKSNSNNKNINNIKCSLQDLCGQLSKIAKLVSDYEDQIPSDLDDSAPSMNVNNDQDKTNTIAYRNNIGINKAADYQATVYSDDAGTSIFIDKNNAEEFRKALEVAINKLEEIHSSMNNLKLDSNESNSGVDELASSTPTTNNSELAPPHERFASLEQLDELTATIESKLSQMKDSLEKLANNSTTQEENMSRKDDLNNKVAYPQGTEEPTKYPVDPSNVKARFEDKHMVGVDNLGGADGLVPGDLERKKMMSRAEEDQRQLRRAAVVRAAKEALEKNAYPQGTEEPTTYPKDKGNEEAREKGDKHMVGKSPFPGVGKTDDLYPGDKKEKEMLQRASLSAKFQKKEAKGESTWEVYEGEKLVLSASVDELSGGRSELMFDSIATKEFGKGLITKVRKEGAQKVSSLMKKAQEMPAPAPMPEVDVEPTNELPEGDLGDGDPSSVVKDLSEKLQNLASDLAEAVSALTGDLPEMDAVEPTEEMVAAADDSSLASVRDGLGSSLVKAMSKSIDGLNKHVEELNLIGNFYDNGTVKPENKAFAKHLTEEAVKEAKEAAADGFKLVTAFVKFARANSSLTKQAQEAQEGANTMDVKPEEGNNLSEEVDSADKELEDLLKSLDLESDSKYERDESLPPDNTNLPEDLSNVHDGNESNISEDTNVDSSTKEFEDVIKSLDLESDSKYERDEEKEDDNDLKAEMDELSKIEVKPGQAVDLEVSADKNFDLTTKAGRAAARAQLAAEAMGESHSLQQAHPQGGTVVDFDVKPEGDGAKVETIDEVHDKMMDIANAPPRVRKEAENLHRLVVEGAITENDFDDLVAEGLDSDAVAYYKKYYGEVDGGSEFAAELVKEHTKAAVEDQVNKYQVKLGRAYELAYDMADRGLVNRDRESITASVNEILEYNDESFESLKKIVAHNKPIQKESSAKIPHVGHFGGGDPLTQTSNKSDSLYEQLSDVFSSSKGRMF